MERQRGRAARQRCLACSLVVCLLASAGLLGPSPAHTAPGAMMKAAVWAAKATPLAGKARYPCESYDLVLKDVPKPPFDPKATPGKALVRVKAAALNPVDCKVIPPWWLGGPRPFGRDFSGVVEAVAEGNKRGLKVGDAVIGFGSEGVCREFVVQDVNGLTKKPDSVDFEAAAGLGVVCFTDYDALFSETTAKARRAPISEDSRVLIIGASGGTGMVAVQMAKRCANAKLVVGVCSGRNAEMVTSCGADRVVDYTQLDLPALSATTDVEELRKAFGGELFDVVYDCVSSSEGDFDYKPIAKRLLQKPGGQYVCINSSSGKAWIKGLLSMGTGRDWFQKADEDLFLPKFTPEKGDKLSQWMGEEKLKLPVWKAVDFRGNLNEAWEAQISRRAVGKVVITNIASADAGPAEVCSPISIG